MHKRSARQTMQDELSDRGKQFIANSLLWAVWSDEDYVGKVCRLARRVQASRLVVLRVFTRSLMQYKRHFEKKMG